MTDKLALRPAEAAQLLGIGKNAVFELCRQGIIPSTRLGRRILIPRRLLERWLEERVASFAIGAQIKAPV